jgi:hypothetical protein
VKNIALAAMLTLTLELALCPSAQAGPAPENAGHGMVEFTLVQAAVPAGGRVVLQSATSELAEPEVLAMMLLGLCLIGYRVRRDSSEKFK